MRLQNIKVLSFLKLIFAVTLLILSSPLAARAQASGGTQVTPLINQPINLNQVVTLPGNTRSEANAQNDQGVVPGDFPMAHMMLQLRRSPAQQQELDELVEQLHDPASPNFHQWLTPAEMGARFGLAAADLGKIAGWLTAQGFNVNEVYPNGLVIDFSGTASQVLAAFRTPIHFLQVNGEWHFANTSDPQIPAAIAPAVAGIVSLHNFRPAPQFVPGSQYTIGGGGFLVVPADLATIYNLNPVFAAGVTGQGQTITLVEDTDLFTDNDWNTFRTTFGLSGFGATLTTTHPPAPSGANNCGDPGHTPDDGEAILDAEWATAAAPSAAIVIAACPSSGNSTFGFFVAIQNLINSSSPPAIVSMSYGVCEAQLGATANAAIKTAYQQGVAEGMSIFVSAGDQLSTACDRDANGATHGHNVNGLASTQFNVAVGGTDFLDLFTGTSNTYWNAANSATFASAKSYIPELPWNDTCASQLLSKFVTGSTVAYGLLGFCNNAGSGAITIGGGSGGPSNCASGTPAFTNVGGTGTCAGYAKPSFQSGLVGMPNDGVRDLPDVSLFSAAGLLGHAFVYCFSDAANQGNGCSGAPSGWNRAGGTSFASPILAGFQALVNQHVGTSQGNPNMVYYALAKAEYGASGNANCNSSRGNAVANSCIFYDVTQGDIDAPCIPGSFSCYAPSGSIGVLSASTTSFQPEYVATTGYDYATGIGTVNAYNLVVNWPNSSINDTLTVVDSGSGTVTSGDGKINCGGACSASYFGGTPVSLTATPANGFSFAGWSGGGCSGTGGCAVFVTASTTVTATFQQNPPPSFILTVSNSGNGTVTSSPAGINCGGTCSASFTQGTQVNLTASAASGFSFAGWGGACSGTGPCTVTMNSAQNVSASFSTSTPPSVILTVSNSGNGTVTSSPAGINCGATCSASYPSGTVVSLTESAGGGSSFAGWGGACSGVGTCVVTMNAAQSVTASFVQGTSPTSALLAAVLPSSRSAVVNNPVTAFATIINSGSAPAPQCAISPIGGLPLNFTYQTTNPATNAVTGSANTPIDIPAGAFQSFVIALTPTTAFGPTQVAFSFACSNVLAAPIETGLNTLLLSASATPVPDIVALAATTRNDGILHIGGSNASSAFAVATVNVGTTSAATATANTGSATLPLGLSLCQTDPETGQCISAIGSSVTTSIAAGATPTFAIFGQANGTIPFDPANSRIFVEFSDGSGIVRGSTSVAVTTQ